MRKLIYMSLAALALQTCANATQPAAPSPAPAPSPTTAPAPGSIDLAGQVGIVAGAEASSAASGIVGWFEKEGKGLEHGVEREGKKLEHDAERDRFRLALAKACGISGADAVQALNQCHQFRNEAKNCFADICTKLSASPQDPAYVAVVTPALLNNNTWKYKIGNTPPQTYTYAQSLGCGPNGAPIIPVAPSY